MEPDDVVVGIVALNGGELVGRTRLQKTAFLLEHCGMASGVPFDYYRYGPFAAELARGWDEAAAAGRLEMAERPGSHEMPYTVFSTDSEPPEKLGELDRDRAQEFLGVLDRYSDVVIELAATIVYLRERDFSENVIEELKVRKPLKATDKRIKDALELLNRLGLGVEDPAAS